MDRYGDQEVTVTYDDDQAGVPQLMELLERNQYAVSGKPVIIQ